MDKNGKGLIMTSTSAGIGKQTWPNATVERVTGTGILAGN